MTCPWPPGDYAREDGELHTPAQLLEKFGCPAVSISDLKAAVLLAQLKTHTVGLLISSFGGCCPAPCSQHLLVVRAFEASLLKRSG